METPGTDFDDGTRSDEREQPGPRQRPNAAEELFSFGHVQDDAGEDDEDTETVE